MFFRAPIPLSKFRQIRRARQKALILMALPVCSGIMNGATGPPVPLVVHDAQRKTVSLSDGSGNLQIRLRYDGPCALDRVSVCGRIVVSRPPGVVSTALVRGKAWSSAKTLRQPQVTVTDSSVTVSEILYGDPKKPLRETWVLVPTANHIYWMIEAEPASPLEVEDRRMPNWLFDSTGVWSAGLLGTGGVAWWQLIGSAHGTYAAHTGKVRLWKRGARGALEIHGLVPSGGIATAFTRTADRRSAIRFTVGDPLPPLKYDPDTRRRRYLPNREDVWAPFTLDKRPLAVEYRLTAVEAKQEYDLGEIKHFREESIQALARTAARLGVIDAGLHGSNSWRTPYGPAVLHEPFIAQLGLLIQDRDYWESYKATLDFYRENAILPDGRVKPRWAYTCEDAIPGTCDSLGFYEAQWGILMDSNPDFVTNVAELFDYTGDRQWLRGQKEACERALEFILRRDSDEDGLVEMMTDDHTEARGSDWLDIIWASHENAFVNAKLYNALLLWSEVERLLGDAPRAGRYAELAGKLKEQFNEPVEDGGFWEADSGWYVHWRDRDGSIHGNNLATFVNFQAIAYGLCDDPERRASILGKIEEQMKSENLFFWPVCIYSYAEGEGLDWQFPFPKYENGDIFLSLGEVGVRAYRDYDPSIPVKYIGKLLDQYDRDGLAFQRYNRLTQSGEGDDILAGNSLALVGLYRNIYGVQPKYNRLLVDPRLTPPLYGTRLFYLLRDDRFVIDLDSGAASVSMDGLTFNGATPFGVSRSGDTLTYFHGLSPQPALAITRSGSGSVRVTVGRWETAGTVDLVWEERTPSPAGGMRYRLMGLVPSTAYLVSMEGGAPQAVRADQNGTLQFTGRPGRGDRRTYRVSPAGE